MWPSFGGTNKFPQPLLLILVAYSVVSNWLERVQRLTLDH